ncbi:MAG: hypothetical protein HRU18_02660 [Pseudoalteromonas sp.]|uniref:hypothetical protein n=1 Tax=Pseudoalteromonas sp. TaxID=53249 RepID=UPI001D5B0DFE|nr:hypothetical protein [Pseudoalteromonas sp.]NRA77085.1 hypothetical protein [Pseudoalteromonas sp.]
MSNKEEEAKVAVELLLTLGGWSYTPGSKINSKVWKGFWTHTSNLEACVGIYLPNTSFRTKGLIKYWHLNISADASHVYMDSFTDLLKELNNE